MARQFFYHARFAADQPVLSDDKYLQIIRAVIVRHPRIPSKVANQIIIPGFTDLRKFSRAREKLLKAECGPAWRSYFLRSHWRMAFSLYTGAPDANRRIFSRCTPAKPSCRILHLVKFPAMSINHCIVLFAATETGRGWEFESYDLGTIPKNRSGLHVRPDVVTDFFPGTKSPAGHRRRPERQPHLPLCGFSDRPSCALAARTTDQKSSSRRD